MQIELRGPSGHSHRSFRNKSTNDLLMVLQGAHEVTNGPVELTRGRFESSTCTGSTMHKLSSSAGRFRRGVCTICTASVRADNSSIGVVRGSGTGAIRHWPDESQNMGIETSPGKGITKIRNRNEHMRGKYKSRKSRNNQIKFRGNVRRERIISAKFEGHHVVEELHE